MEDTAQAASSAFLLSQPALLFLTAHLAGKFCCGLHQLMQLFQYRGSLGFTQKGCGIFFESRIKCLHIWGFEKDQIPGRHFRVVLANSIVNAIFFCIPFKPTDMTMCMKEKKLDTVSSIWSIFLLMVPMVFAVLKSIVLFMGVTS